MTSKKITKNKVKEMTRVKMYRKYVFNTKESSVEEQKRHDIENTQQNDRCQPYQ